MTKEQFDKWHAEVLGMEEVFPTGNQYPYEQLLKMINGPNQDVEKVQLQAGDQFVSIRTVQLWSCAPMAIRRSFSRKTVG